MTIQQQLFSQSAQSWNPHKYQKKGVKFLLEHAAAALFLDPGLGKTSITLAATKILKQRGLVNKVLIVAPLRVCVSVWPREIEKWKDFSGLRAVVLHGPRKDELLKSDADIYIINPEGLDWLLATSKSRTSTGKTAVTVDMRRWKKLGFDTLIIDELAKFKHTNTVRFKALKMVLGTFARRWGLTGSPAANGLLDLFGQCYVLDQGRALGAYITHYKSKYFNPSYDGFNWVLRDGADAEIYKRIQPLALRMAAEDYLDMPELIENDIWLDLPDNVRSLYDELEDELITIVNDRTVVAATAAAASMKCRQVANGGLYYDVDPLGVTTTAKREFSHLHDVKTDAVLALVEELQGNPLLVAYEFAHDLDRLQRALGKDVPYIGGGVSTKKSAIIERAWNNGELPVLLGQPQSMAHGLNLQGAGHHVCWHSLTWDYELYDQLVRRVFRQGNTHATVFVHRILMRGTVDIAVLSAIRAKAKGQRALFDALKALGRSR